MSRSRNSNRKAIIQAITSAKNEIIAEIQRANNGTSQTSDFSSIRGPTTMNELVNSEQDDISKGPMTLNELINSIPDDSNDSIQYASQGPMTLNELINSIQDDSKGPMTMNELESPSPSDSPEVVLLAGRSRKQKSRRMKRTGQSKSRKYRRNTRK